MRQALPSRNKKLDPTKLWPSLTLRPALAHRAAQFALSVDELVHFSQPSNDALFESAADEYAERQMGIILTGASEDGRRASPLCIAPAA